MPPAGAGAETPRLGAQPTAGTSGAGRRKATEEYQGLWGSQRNEYIAASVVFGGLLLWGLIAGGRAVWHATHKPPSYSASGPCAGWRYGTCPDEILDGTMTEDEWINSHQTSGDSREEPAPAATDTSIVDALRRAGVSDDAVNALGIVADDTGYGRSPENPLGLEERRNFAYVELQVCRDVASGAKSWQQIEDEDIAGGAPPDAAQRMVAYVRYRFCPDVTLG